MFEEKGQKIMRYISKGLHVIDTTTDTPIFKSIALKGRNLIDDAENERYETHTHP